MAATAYHFFLSNAGYSYDPKTETPMEGRIKCAKELAKAEQWAHANGIKFAWEVSDINASDFSDENYPLWDCYAYSYIDGEPVIQTSMGAVDFGADGTPEGSTYARVVCAQLVFEMMAKGAGSAQS